MGAHLYKSQYKIVTSSLQEFIELTNREDRVKRNGREVDDHCAKDI